MMELWGGFPSREMLKSRGRVKGSHCGLLSLNSYVGAFGFGSEGTVAGQEGQGKGASPRDSLNLGSWGRS